MEHYERPHPLPPRAGLFALLAAVLILGLGAGAAAKQRLRAQLPITKDSP